ncbi:unnamed protein product [Arctia plantaginis]|uniref:POC1 centriolar protein homolog A n=1 Tax=Arctia plantaginis TaxID=874455 RepID=A0A8S0ZSF2_ARCPL|nr:unnamed protein product [Arctia plantaginis]
METKFTYLEPSLEKQLKGHKNAITALYFNPNEQQIASSSLDNSVLLWDLRGTMRSYRFQGHDEAVMDVTFSPSGKYMASASRDKTVRLWVPTVTGSTGMFKAHSQTVRSVQFNCDGSKIITASDDKIVKLWSTEKHKFIASYVGHTNWKGHSLCLAWHPSGCYVAVGTSHGNVKLYDVRTHSLVQYYSIHNDAVTQIAFHPSGSYILTSSKDGKMKILDLLEGHPIFTLSGHTGAINTVNFSASGETFASAGDDKLVFIWKTNFTELVNDVKENIPQTMSTIPKSASQTSKLTSASRGKSQESLSAVSSKYMIALQKLEFRETCDFKYNLQRSLSY